MSSDRSDYALPHQKGFVEAVMILQVVEMSQKSGVGLRFVREMEQGKETLRLDKVNQVLALFGAEMAPMKVSES